MEELRVLQLAQDLEWLGFEAHYYAKKPDGPAAEVSIEKQREVLRTADKLQRELKTAIRYNPERLVGVVYPVEDTLESIANLLTALEDIKQSTLSGEQELPDKLRSFSCQIHNTFGPTAAEAA